MEGEMLGVGIVERHQGLEVTLCVYPTQGEVMDIKLPGIVADDNEFVVTVVVVCAGAEQGGFGGEHR